MNYSLYFKDGSPSEKLLVERKQVEVIEANNIIDAYKKAMNIINPTSTINRCPDIGDVILEEETGNPHMITGNGFRLMDKNILKFIDWGKELPRRASIRLIAYPVND